MNNKFFFVLAFQLLIWNIAFTQISSLSEFFSKSDQLFSNYVHQDVIDYTSIKTNGELNELILFIENFD